MQYMQRRPANPVRPAVIQRCRMMDERATMTRRTQQICYAVANEHMVSTTNLFQIAVGCSATFGAALFRDIGPAETDRVTELNKQKMASFCRGKPPIPSFFLIYII